MVNMWLGLCTLGNVWGFLFETWLIDSRGLYWGLAFFILTMIYFATGILTYVVVPESIRENEDENLTITEEISQNY